MKDIRYLIRKVLNEQFLIKLFSERKEEYLTTFMRIQHVVVKAVNVVGPRVVD